MSFAKAAYDAAEGGEVTVTVTLSAVPERRVEIPITAEGGGGAEAGDWSVAPASVTFESGDASKTFTVAAADDAVDDDGETVLLGFGALPERVSAGTIAAAEVSIVDDDTAAVAVSVSSLSVAEGGEETYTVALGSEPTDAVTVAAAVAGPAGADVTVEPAALTFAADDWDSPQTVTVAAAHDDDAVDGAATVTHTAAGGGYDAVSASVEVTVDDDDHPRVTVSFGAAAHSVAEGGEVTVEVTLSAVPERTVVIPITATGRGGAAAGDWSVAPASVTFASGDASKAFTLTATQDNVDDDGESVLLGFGTLPERVAPGATDTAEVSIVDDDTAAVAASVSSLSVGEGGEETYTVELGSEPTAAVTVTAAVAGGGGVTAAPAALTFTASDWDSPQTVTVAAGHDDDAVDGAATVTHTAAGGGYDAVSATVEVTVDDDDHPRVAVSFGAASYSVAESDDAATAAREDQAVVTVTLSAVPERTVEIPITATGQNGATAGDWSGAPTSVTFDSDDTSKAFTLTAAGDDIDDDGETVLLGFGDLPERVGADPAAATATVAIDDDDDRGVELSETRLAVAEGEVGSYTVRLRSQPTGAVTVTVTGHAGTDVAPDPESLHYTPQNWDAPQTVQVAAGQDDDSDDDTATLAHTAAGGDYTGADPATVTVAVTDDDPATNNEPAFPAETATRNVEENSPPATRVGDPVTATDEDAGDTLAYTLGGNNADLFTIDGSNGQISVGSGTSLDYETRNTYSVTVSVSDGKDPGGNSDGTIDDSIAVTVTVINEEEPGTVALSSARPKVGAELTAMLEDPDEVTGAPIWSWHRSTDGNGNWTPIEGETSDSYVPAAGDEDSYLRAKAHYTDGEGSGKIAMGTSDNPVSASTPNAQDRSEECGKHNGHRSAYGLRYVPYLTLEATPRHVREGDAAPVVATLSCRLTGDPADISFKYYAYHDDDETAGYKETPPLTEDRSSSDDYDHNESGTWVYFSPGELTVTFTIQTYTDNLAERIENFWVRVGKSYQSAFMIPGPITNVKIIDVPPRRAPPSPTTNNEPAFPAETATRNVEENSPPATRVGDPVTATDEDAGDTLAYTLGGNNADLFTIDGSNGQISVGSGTSLDYETRNTYSVTVSVSDGKDPGGNSDGTIDDSIAVTVTVINEEEPGTVALSSARPKVGAELTAMLEDPDEVTGAPIWSWHRSTDGNGNWTPIEGETSDSYVPAAGDEDSYLRAKAHYTDGEGSGKIAMGTSDNPVSASTPNAQDRSEECGKHNGHRSAYGLRYVPYLTLEATPRHVREGDAAPVVATLSCRLTGDPADISFKYYAYHDDDETAGYKETPPLTEDRSSSDDYDHNESGTWVYFSPGELTVTFTIQTYTDNLAERIENFWVRVGKSYQSAFMIPGSLTNIKIIDVPAGN